MTARDNSEKFESRPDDTRSKCSNTTGNAASAARILRAITDVDDTYVQDAVRFAERKRHNARAKILPFRRTVTVAAALAACLAVAVISSKITGFSPRSSSSGGTAVSSSEGQQLVSASPDSGSSDYVTAESAQDFAAEGNPYQEVSSLAEAAAITGFDLAVPDAPEDYPDMTIQVIDSSMIEVIYENKANETAEGTDEGYRIRKAAGNADISGDYNEYADTRTEKIGDYDVTLKGDGKTISVATWTAGGYSYAVDAENHPMDLNMARTIIGCVK